MSWVCVARTTTAVRARPQGGFCVDLVPVTKMTVPAGSRRGVMTLLLEQAIDEVRTLRAAEQDALARLILDQDPDNGIWDEKFVQSQDMPAYLTDKARADSAAGRGRPASSRRP